MSEMMSQLIFATKKLLIVALIVIAGGVAGHAQENLPEETGARGTEMAASLRFMNNSPCLAMFWNACARNMSMRQVMRSLSKRH